MARNLSALRSHPERCPTQVDMLVWSLLPCRELAGPGLTTAYGARQLAHSHIYILTIEVGFSQTWLESDIDQHGG